ncbi:MAG: response regulator [Elusimicrobiota bacterium]|jgi:two-component system OmpR family response regulator
MIADDDPDLLELLKMDLSYQGYDVSAASDGREALALATKERFDLVLLDVMMPYIDGYHVAYELSSKLGPNAPKIVIMTSRDTVREKGIAMMSGAMTVIQKPFGMAELHTRLTEILSKP